MKNRNLTATEIISLSLKTALCYFVFFVFLFTVPIVDIIKAYDNKIKKEYSEDVILFEDVVIHVEKVSSIEDMNIGLSKYNSLPKDDGMLFIFNKNDYHAIWMKDMKFDIDIIWLDESLRIVDIAYNVSKDSYPKTYTPKEKARYVLEVNAGFAKENYLKVGEQAVLFDKP